MKVSIEEISTCQKVLSIEVPSEKITAEVEDLYKEIAKTATHPGFRKGKVPRKILEAKHGSSIRQEAVSGAISSSAKDAIDEHKLVPLTEPELGEVNDDENGPLTFKVTIEVKPSIKLSEYTGIELKRIKKEVTDEDIMQVIERLQHSHAKYAPADRPVETGDFIVFDFKAFEDGKPLQDGKGENFSLEVGSGHFGEDFETQVVGMSKDEEKRIKVKYPDDYKSEELAGKELEFDVKLKDVKLRELPELNDDFAKDLGEHETLEELKQSCRERLEKDVENRLDNLLREQAIAHIVAESEVEVPPRLREKVAASVLEERVQTLMQYGTDQETITAQRDQLTEFAGKEAERQIKVSFLTDEIAEREDLSISDEELEKNLEDMANESGDKGAQLREYFKQEKIRERYREQLRAKKILDFIVSGAKIVEVDEADAESESAEPEQLEKDKEGES